MLNQTRPWVLFIGVLLWIGTVLMGLVSVGMIVMSIMGGKDALPMILIAALYLIFVLVYAMMAYSLTNYASRIYALRASESVLDLEGAIEAQKNFWRIVGISMIAIFVIYILLAVLMIAGMAMFTGF